MQFDNLGKRKVPHPYSHPNPCKSGHGLGAPTPTQSAQKRHGLGAPTPTQSAQKRHGLGAPTRKLCPFMPKPGLMGLENACSLTGGRDDELIKVFKLYHYPAIRNQPRQKNAGQLLISVVEDFGFASAERLVLE